MCTLDEHGSPVTGSEGGTTIVCLHGLGRSASDWDGVRPGLERYGSVHVADLPRAGLDALVAATAELPAAAVLVGHSIGGMVALRRAALDPPAVAGLILTDSFFPPALNGRSRSATLTDYAAHRAALVRELAARGARPRPRRGTVRGMRSLARLALRPSAFHAMAAAVRAPVLVLHARDDHHVPVDFAIAAAARHPSWTIELLGRGGHSAHVDQPAEWLAAARPWLDHQLSAGAPGRDRT